jgi:hypothetical protein
MQMLRSQQGALCAYDKLLGEREYRLEWAERIGLGFDLPTPIGQLGQLRIVPKVA